MEKIAFISFLKDDLKYPTNDLDPVLIMKEEIQSFLIRNFDLILNSETYYKKDFLLAIELFESFDNLIQLVEVTKKKIKYLEFEYIYTYHFFNKYEYEKWDNKGTSFSVIRNGRNLEISNLIKAPLITVEELRNLKINNITRFFKGQKIENNEWYFSNGPEVYCLPLKKIIKGAFANKVFITYDSVKKVFTYSYSFEYKVGGSGWYRTDYYEGEIDIVNWQVSEIKVNTVKEKWD